MGGNVEKCPDQGYLAAGIGGQRKGLAELLSSTVRSWAPPFLPYESLERLMVNLPLPQK